MKRVWIGVVLCWLAATGFAQEEACPVLERAAVAEAQVWCPGVRAGELCYGNDAAAAQLGAAEAVFQAVGDRVPLSAVQSVSTQRGELAHGIVLLHTLAYPQDSWRAAALHIVLLGDAALTDASPQRPFVPSRIQAIQGANVRAIPAENGRILTPLFQDAIVMLTGRTADGQWLRLQLPSGEAGWVIASAVEGDTAALPTVSAQDDAPGLLYAPFAAFDLQTGRNDAACVQAWESGALLQSSGDDFVRLQVNGLDVQLRGTAFLQADAASRLRLALYVLAGEALFDEQVVPEGEQITVRETDERALLAEPPQPYDFARLAFVPTELLPQYVYIGLDLSTIITPAPAQDRSPLSNMLATEPCVITTGPGGANLRGGPGTDFPVRGVLDFRETARPIGRATGSDGAVWWELAQNVWISATTTVTGGDCAAVPQSQRIPALPPEAQD